jgi:hypothetical protein
MRTIDLPAFGARSALAKDHVYWFGSRGLIFTSPWVVTASTERETAVILLSASGRPMELEVGSCRAWHRAFAIAPLTRRGLRAIDVGLISVNVEPHHPAFPACPGSEGRECGRWREPPLSPSMAIWCAPTKAGCPIARPSPSSRL